MPLKDAAAGRSARAMGDKEARMLCYRVTFDVERGHYVLPAVSGMVPGEETFPSRDEADQVARWRNEQARRTSAPIPLPTPNATIVPVGDQNRASLGT